MSYFAAAFTRTGGGWQGEEIDLDDVRQIEDVAEVASQVESDDGVVVVLVEDEDWFGVVRVDPDDDPKAFVSDAAEAVRSPVGAALLSELAANESPDDLPSEPLGDKGVLDDLGVPSDELHQLAVGIGTSPSEAVAVLAERLGCVDALEAVR